ncbi:hypothetical protein SprV_0200659500 [Sparganum proliferum]
MEHLVHNLIIMLSREEATPDLAFSCPPPPYKPNAALPMTAAAAATTAAAAALRRRESTLPNLEIAQSVVSVLRPEPIVHEEELNQ